jgi:hypothetical protein
VRRRQRLDHVLELGLPDAQIEQALREDLDVARFVERLGGEEALARPSGAELISLTTRLTRSARHDELTVPRIASRGAAVAHDRLGLGSPGA